MCWEGWRKEKSVFSKISNCRKSPLSLGLLGESDVTEGWGAYTSANFLPPSNIVLIHPKAKTNRSTAGKRVQEIGFSGF